MAILNPDHLLDQADRLIAPAGRGAPRQADLRRAISGAYYAVFHTVAIQAADRFVGAVRRGKSDYALVYRSIGHTRLRALCEDVKKSPLPTKYSRFLTSFDFGAELIAFATAVVGLQERRELAEYDPRFRVGASDAIADVATAREALKDFWNANRASRKVFVTLLVFPPRSSA